MRNKKTLFILVFFLIIFVPIFSFADDELLDEFSANDITEAIETSTNITKIPDINARHAIVLDRSSNQILYGKKENEKCKMASTTKIMTCIVVLENCSLSEIVTVSKKAASVGGSELGLSTNDKLTVEDLLYGLMLKSGNDAAIALAEHAGGSIEGFAELMNKKALDLNLSSTHFVTPHGLDNDNHFTTAYDLACITNYALKNETFAKIVKTKIYTVFINGNPKTISNTNELLGNLDGIYGVKTGFTNGANRCLVTSCKRGDLDIICVVLGCDTKKDRTQDSIRLINYIFNNYTMINVEEFIDTNFKNWYLLHSNSFTINKGYTQILNLYIDKSSLPYSYMAVNKSDLSKVSVSISFTTYHEAPVSANSTIGKLDFKINNINYFSLDIVNSNSVPRKNLLFYFYTLLSNYFKYFKTT